MDELQKTLIGLEEHLFRPEVRRSAKELSKLIADDFIEIGTAGHRFGKSSILARLPYEASPQILASHFELRQLSDNCVQLLYKSKMTKMGQPTIYSLRCSIWRFENEQWQMVYHQGTRCEPF